ncbi:flagellar assembly protein FliW [Kyrpidia spormannii]|uniref:Flagellar assembly factor FliW n=2 Tax=Kyrpidia spormannii TaxID=2055160 RepID=A0ACA8ZDM5_9BACL
MVVMFEGTNRSATGKRSMPLIRFESGIPGFPEVRRFALHPIPEREGWFRLFGVEEGDPAFLVVDPFFTCAPLQS